ncbi:thermonuclease family protein [Sphingobium yanoikuyae]|uniref:thermonuclease family protein n=1 Tax=Sphingobium yanoikuyae TaxID=13690 RepID=UPI0009BEFBA6|nr:thermonuclease family protein [Sphingobium yanoikuyae]MDG2515564.1 thermonuclease family protein [Sphingobium yanoikuyae]
MILPILLLSIWSPPATCTAVDGDTLRCSEIGRVRLLGIDAPEMAGHCRKGRTCAPGDPVASKKALEKLVARGVTISPVTRDRYGRTVAQVYADDKNLACEQLRRGVAVYMQKWDNGGRLAKECRYAGPPQRSR